MKQLASALLAGLVFIGCGDDGSDPEDASAGEDSGDTDGADPASSAGSGESGSDDAPGSNEAYGNCMGQNLEISEDACGPGLACIPSFGPGGQGQYCSPACTTPNDGSDCPPLPGAANEPSCVGVEPRDTPSCGVNCSTDDECPEGFVCIAVCTHAQ
jgi:hypothetical protein